MTVPNPSPPERRIGPATVGAAIGRPARRDCRRRQAGRGEPPDGCEQKPCGGRCDGVFHVPRGIGSADDLGFRSGDAPGRTAVAHPSNGPAGPARPKPRRGRSRSRPSRRASRTGRPAPEGAAADARRPATAPADPPCPPRPPPLHRPFKAMEPRRGAQGRRVPQVSTWQGQAHAGMMRTRDTSAHRRFSESLSQKVCRKTWGNCLKAEHRAKRTMRVTSSSDHPLREQPCATGRERDQQGG